MPELYFKVAVAGGKATISELNKLDTTYRNVGVSGQRSFQNAGKAASVFGGQLSQLKTLVLGLGATFGVMGIAMKVREWVGAAVEGQRVWANVTTLIDKNKDYTDALYDSLKRVNAELGSTKDLAQGMYWAISSNIPAEKAVKFVETAAKFAKAAVTDVYTSVDLMTSVINAYGYEVEDAMEVSDKLFQMVRKGKTTGEDLAHSLGLVIPTAATLDVSLEQLGAAFATMTQMGINSRITVTALNQALMAFMKSPEQAKKLSKELGVDLTVTGLRAKGLAQSLSDVAKAVEGNEELTATLFGNVRALRAVMALTGEQAGTYARYLREMENATGLTNIALEKQVGTLGAQWEALWINVAKIFKNALGQGMGLTNMLRSMNAAMADGVIPLNKYTVALAMFALTLTGIKLMGIIGGIALFKDVIAGIQLVAAARGISALGTAFGLLGGVLRGVLTFLTGPFGIALAVAGISALAYSAVSKSEEASYRVRENFRLVKDSLGSIWDEIKNIVVGTSDEIIEEVIEDSKRLSQAKTEWEKYKEWFWEWRELPEAFANIITAITNLWAGAWMTISAIARGAIRQIKGDVLGVLDIGPEIVAGVTKMISGWNVTVPSLDPAIEQLNKFNNSAITSGEKVSTLIQKATELEKTYATALKDYGISISKGSMGVVEWENHLKDVEKLMRDLEEQGIISTKPTKKRIGIDKDEMAKVNALVDAMRKAADPARELSEQLILLQKAGKDTSEFARAFSKQIVEAAESAKVFGTEIPKSVEELIPLAKKYEEAKEKAKSLIDEQKKLVKLLAEDLPEAIAGIQNKELSPNAESLIKYVAKAAELKGIVTGEGEALKYAIDWFERYDELVTRNKENTAKQVDEYLNLHGVMGSLIKDYELLGVEAGKSIAKMADAWEKRKELLTPKGVVDAMTRMVETAVEQMERLPDAVLKDLDEMVFGTDKALRDRLLPQWIEYQRSLRDIQGQFAPETIAALMKVVQGTDTVLKLELYPLWQEYIESVKIKYGSLPKDLKAIDDRLVKEVDQVTGKMREVWLNQVSTIVTDFSKGAADIIFEAKSMSEVVNGIFKEFGKMVTRTLFEALFDPVKKMFRDLIDWIFDSLRKLNRDVTSTVTDMVTTAISSATTKAMTGGFTLWGAAGAAGASNAAPLIQFAPTTVQGGKFVLGEALPPAEGTFGNILSTQAPQTPFPTMAAAAAAGAIPTAATTGAAATGGLFGLPKGGIGGAGIGGPVGGFMTLGGAMLALDALQRTGTRGYLQGALGGGLLGLALGGYPGMFTGAGGMLLTKGWMGTGAGSWAASIGGGALAGAGIGTMILPGIGTAIGAAIGSLVGTIGKLVTIIKGKSTELSGVLEVARDLGDIKLDKDVFKEYYQSLGLSESTAYSIRKDIMMAPKFLTEIAAPAARAQGKMDEFLKSLERVETAWGTFNFREAFELGELTGDWEALDEAYKNAFESSERLRKNLPDWEQKLLMLGDAARNAAKEFHDLYKTWRDTGEISDELIEFLEENAELLDKAAESSALFADELEKARKAAEAWKSVKAVYDGLKGLKEAIEDLNPSAYNMYTLFLETGQITKELSDLITEYGGDLAQFQEMARLGQLNNYFEELVTHFKATGEILPDLRKLFQDFGGDLAALDAAANLPGLMNTLSELDDFVSGLGDILPDLSPLQKILQGIWDQDTWGRLEAMGFDPTKFIKITDLIKYEKGWEQAVDDFYNKTVKVWDENKQRWVEQWAGLEPGGLIEQALYQFGGPEGLLALQRYRQEGINTISPAMLRDLKEKIDEAYKAERSTVLDYINMIRGDVQSQIDTLMAGVEEQFAIVGANLAEAFNEAKTAVVDQLEMILQKIIEGVDLLAGIGTTTPIGTVGGNGGYTYTPPPIEFPDDIFDDTINHQIEMMEGLSRGLEPVINLQNKLISIPSVLERMQATSRNGYDAREMELLNTPIRKVENRDVRESSYGAGEEIHLHLENSTFYNFDDFEQQVADAWEKRYDRGGFSRTVVVVKNR